MKPWHTQSRYTSDSGNEPLIRTKNGGYERRAHMNGLELQTKGHISSQPKCWMDVEVEGKQKVRRGRHCVSLALGSRTNSLDGMEGRKEDGGAATAKAYWATQRGDGRCKKIYPKSSREDSEEERASSHRCFEKNVCYRG